MHSAPYCQGAQPTELLLGQAMQPRSSPKDLQDAGKDKELYACSRAQLWEGDCREKTPLPQHEWGKTGLYLSSYICSCPEQMRTLFASSHRRKSLKDIFSSMHSILSKSTIQQTSHLPTITKGASKILFQGLGREQIRCLSSHRGVSDFTKQPKGTGPAWGRGEQQQSLSSEETELPAHRTSTHWAMRLPRWFHLRVPLPIV